MKRLKALSAVLISALAVSAIAAVPVAINSDGPSTERRERTEFRADLSGNTLASGKARYRSEARGPAVRSRLDVSIEDAEPKTSYDILLNGSVIGSMTTDAFGFAEVTFRSPSDDPDDIPGTPSVESGDVVSVGPVSGSLS